MQVSTPTRGSLELIAAMTLSGFIGYFVLASGQSAGNLIFLRCLFGVIVLAIYAWWRGAAKMGTIERRDLTFIALGGVTLVANWALLFQAFDLVPFSIATVAYHLQPLLLVMAGAWLLRERVTPSIWVWLTVALVGLVLVVDLDLSQVSALWSSAASRVVCGVALAIGAAILYTANTLLSRHTPQVPSHVVALLQVSIGLPLALPFVNFDAMPTNSAAWGYVLLLGAVNTGVQYILMYAAYQRLPTSLIAALSLVYPVVALAVDHLAFGTRLNLQQALGVLLILWAAAAVRLGWSPLRWLQAHFKRVPI